MDAEHVMSQSVGVSADVTERAGLWTRVWFWFINVSSTLLTLHLLPAPCDVTSVGVATTSELPGRWGRGVWDDRVLLTGGGKGMMFKRELRVKQTLRPYPHATGYFCNCRFFPMWLGMTPWGCSDFCTPCFFYFSSAYSCIQPNYLAERLHTTSMYLFILCLMGVWHC